MRLFITFIFLCYTQLIFTCDCSLKPNVDIRDWNDTDLIFTGILTSVEDAATLKKLHFSIAKTYKGNPTKQSITFTITEHVLHTLFTYEKGLTKGEQWIVFSNTDLTKSAQNKYTFKKPNNSNYCSLSKPIITNDTYVTFVEDLYKHPNKKHKTYYKNKVLFAEGSLKNTLAVGTWKYYTEQGKDFYDEGIYDKGKRHGKWIKKAINFKKESVIILEEYYAYGALKERIVYNYINEKKRHEVYGDNINCKTWYKNNKVTQKWTVNKQENTTLMENFKDGKKIKTTIKNHQVF